MLKLIPLMIFMLSLQANSVVLEGVYNGISQRDQQPCVVSLQFTAAKNHKVSPTVLASVAFTNELFNRKGYGRSTFSSKVFVNVFEEQMDEATVDLYEKKGDFESTISFVLADNKLPQKASVEALRYGMFNTTDEDSDACIDLVKEESVVERLRIYDVL